MYDIFALYFVGSVTHLATRTVRIYPLSHLFFVTKNLNLESPARAGATKHSGVERSTGRSSGGRGAYMPMGLFISATPFTSAVIDLSVSFLSSFCVASDLGCVWTVFGGYFIAASEPFYLSSGIWMFANNSINSTQTFLHLSSKHNIESLSTRILKRC